jgi:uncharacterized membrane protein YgcG
MLQIYFAVLVVFIALIAVVPIGAMVAYGKNDPRNQACYNAGYTDGQQNNAYSKKMFNQCGINGRAYYEGFLSGCISGQGKDYFACQKLTNAPIGGGSSSNGDNNTSSNGGGGGGGFGGFGGGGGGGRQ